MSQAERLKKVINSLLETPHSFAMGIKLPTAATIYDILKGKRQISRAVLRKIKEAYPELNTEWLLTGEGEVYLWKRGFPEAETLKEKEEKYGNDCSLCNEQTTPCTPCI